MQSLKILKLQLAATLNCLEAFGDLNNLGITVDYHDDKFYKLRLASKSAISELNWQIAHHPDRATESTDPNVKTRLPIENTNLIGKN